MSAPASRPLLAFHAFRLEPLMEASPRDTLALAMLERADPEPVQVKAFREAFGCTASQTSHVLARLRAAGLVTRDEGGGYRLTFVADALRSRVARLLAGQNMPDLPAPPPEGEPAVAPIAKGAAP